MIIKTDTFNRVLIEGNKGFGRYGDRRNWVKVSGKNNPSVTIDKKKVYLNELTILEDYELNNGEKISTFKVIL